MGIDELVFAPLKEDARELIDYLVRRILEVIPPDDVPAVIRLLQVLAAGLRAQWATETEERRS